MTAKRPAKPAAEGPSFTPGFVENTIRNGSAAPAYEKRSARNPGSTHNVRRQQILVVLSPLTHPILTDGAP